MPCGCTTTNPTADNCPDQFIPPQPPDGSCSNPFIVARLTGLRAELANLGSMGGGYEHCNPAAIAQVLLPGDGSKSYLLTMRARGAVEFNAVTGGTWISTSINEGGSRDVNSNAVFFGFGADQYILNGYQDPVPAIDILQYDLTFQVTVLDNIYINIALGSDTMFQLSNTERVPPIYPPVGVPPYPDYFNGQFMQLDCLSAVQL